MLLNNGSYNPGPIAGPFDIEELEDLRLVLSLSGVSMVGRRDLPTPSTPDWAMSDAHLKVRRSLFPTAPAADTVTTAAPVGDIPTPPPSCLGPILGGLSDRGGVNLNPTASLSRPPRPQAYGNEVRTWIAPTASAPLLPPMNVILAAVRRASLDRKASLDVDPPKGETVIPMRAAGLSPEGAKKLRFAVRLAQLKKELRAEECARRVHAEAAKRLRAAAWPSPLAEEFRKAGRKLRLPVEKMPGIKARGAALLRGFLGARGIFGGPCAPRTSPPAAPVVSEISELMHRLNLAIKKERLSGRHIGLSLSNENRFNALLNFERLEDF